MAGVSYGFTTRDALEGIEVPFSVLERSPDIACQLNADLEIIYCNPAWDAFALANGGELAVADAVRGLSVMDVVPEVLQEFYVAAFQKARKAIVEFDYQCSSPDTLRQFRMQIFPNRSLEGFTVLNSKIVEEPIVEGLASQHIHFENESGLIRMCSHCRRSQRQNSHNWDWVPAHFDRRVLNISHGLCPVCCAYFYGEATRSRRRVIGSAQATREE